MSTLLMKYRAIILIALIMLVGGCHRSGNESDNLESKKTKYPDPVNIDLDKIRERGSLIAIVDNSSTGYFIYKGRPMGYDYDLLKLFADYLELPLEVKFTPSIDKAFEMLNNGQGDIIAYSLTVTKERKERVAFTTSHFTTRQMLVQRKPENWLELTKDDLENTLIRDQVDLLGKEVHVRKHSSYIERLNNLAQEIGGDIIVVEEPDSIETEGLIKMVAEDQIEYTIADETVAVVNASYYPSIDVKTPISFPQNIAWAVRKNSVNLLSAANAWLKRIKREPTFNVIYNKYFKSTRASVLRAKSDFSSISGKGISQYDEYLKEAADSIGWDWRLLAAQMFRESKFDPNAKSWAGAIGLMQLVPETGKRFGAKDLYNPKQNIFAASHYLQYLDGLWSKTIKDQEERIKFVLASYNVGLGHVEDARNLADKYGADPTAWNDNVEKYLQLKSHKDYFTDPIVNSGYCRGDEPVNYVRDILLYFEQYKQLINS